MRTFDCSNSLINLKTICSCSSVKVDVLKFLSSYEKNKQYPSVEVLIQLCQTFDVSADYLLGLSDDKNFNTSTLTEEQLQIVLRLINEFEQSNVLKER
ncbi:helix-turn-helix domain-containing protein [Lactococcus lactis]